MSNDDDCMCGVETKTTKSTISDKKLKDSVLSQSIYDKSVLSPSDLANKANPKAIVSKCNGIQPFKLEDMEIEKVLVEYRIKGKPNTPPKKEIKKILEAPKRLDICDALKLAGFQMDWTKEKVANMLKTPDGSELVKKVDIEYRKLSGKSALNEKDIIKCYPNYLKKEKRNVELTVELDGDENILSVTSKKDNKDKKEKSKFNL